uniref:Uncharacterized protein n=1 Tax=Rhizophora mucronata TaxID=61149 RepID=A0A2P2JQF8_RHIMU
MYWRCHSRFGPCWAPLEHAPPSRVFREGDGRFRLRWRWKWRRGRCRNPRERSIPPRECPTHQLAGVPSPRGTCSPSSMEPKRPWSWRLRPKRRFRGGGCGGDCGWPTMEPARLIRRCQKLACFLASKWLD